MYSRAGSYLPQVPWEAWTATLLLQTPPRFVWTLHAGPPGLRSHRVHLRCCCCFRKESKSSPCSSSWAEMEAGALDRADSKFSKVPSDWPTAPGVTQLPNFIHRVGVDASLFVALSPSDRHCV